MKQALDKAEIERHDQVHQHHSEPAIIPREPAFLQDASDIVVVTILIVGSLFGEYAQSNPFEKFSYLYNFVFGTVIPGIIGFAGNFVNVAALPLVPARVTADLIDWIHWAVSSFSPLKSLQTLFDSFSLDVFQQHAPIQQPTEA
jgi:hypothetical protein